ncbi:GPI transamidase component GPI16 [Candida viswanathii]|uniref:GPI transamidase component GPI16 n=1 Tax=Candida viswanathii TaxID=5486 RepID=A0A367Y9S9_9ASCO|nr:GPI transamidase component GPI16 [Candida viswanathii]
MIYQLPVLLVSLLAYSVCANVALDENRHFQELLRLKPLPRNRLLTNFEFEVESSAFDISYNNESSTLQKPRVSHYNYFPNSLGSILESTNTKQLQLRFTQGWWDSNSWGKLPFDGKYSGGTGVEVSAVIEAPNVDAAKKSWLKLTKTLSGFFCASLNFIDDHITTYPKYAVEELGNIQFAPEAGNKLYLLRAALPSEPVCTENLTPFLKLLPTRGKSGVSSLLDGHKVFDSLWHGMSIDVTTKCDESNNQLCTLKLRQTVNQVVDIIRSMRKRKEGAIPKPTPGEELRCDMNKTYNSWQCFPLGDPVSMKWDLETIYGRPIKGAAFGDDSQSSKVMLDIDSSSWTVNLLKQINGSTLSNELAADSTKPITQYLDEVVNYDFEFVASDSSTVLPVAEPPLYASRSLTGYSLDQGGLRTVFTNPRDKPVKFVYFESTPWYMRLYLNTLKLSLKNSTGSYEISNQGDYIKNVYFRPAVDRARPSHMELVLVVPPKLTLAMSYDFDKSLLLYREYPPDANHGFDVEPAVITIFDDESEEKLYEFRTTSLLLTLPTPDFSMPYNVIIMTCTVLSLSFGTLFNILTKKVVTEEEFEAVAANTKLAKLKRAIRSKVQYIKSLKN